MINHENIVKNWFRYQHYSTSVASDSHNHFITCLGYLETKCNVILCDDLKSVDDDDDDWKDILSCINKLTDDEIDHLYYLIKSVKRNF